MEAHRYAEHAVRHDPVPKPASQPTLAYDRAQLPVLKEHLSSSDLDVVLPAAASALRWVASDYRSSFKAHECGILDTLAKLALLGDEDARATQVSLTCLDILRTLVVSPGQRADTIGHAGVMAALKATFDSTDARRRGLAYATVAIAAEQRECQALCIASGLVEALTRRLLVETGLPASGGEASAVAACPDAHLVDGLAKLLGNREADAIARATKAGAVPPLTGVALPPPGLDVPAPTRTRAADALAQLCFENDGRRQCAGITGAVAGLTQLCGSSDAALATAAASCVMSLALEDEAKQTIAQEGMYPALVSLVKPGLAAAPAALAAAKALATVAAFPPARMQMRELPALVLTLKAVAESGASSSSIVVAAAARAAKAAVDMILWEPR